MKGREQNKENALVPDCEQNNPNIFGTAAWGRAGGKGIVRIFLRASVISRHINRCTCKTKMAAEVSTHYFLHNACIVQSCLLAEDTCRKSPPWQRSWLPGKAQCG